MHFKFLSDFHFLIPSYFVSSSSIFISSHLFPVSHFCNFLLRTNSKCLKITFLCPFFQSINKIPNPWILYELGSNPTTRSILPLFLFNYFEQGTLYPEPVINSAPENLLVSLLWSHIFLLGCFFWVLWLAN